MADDFRYDLIPAGCAVLCALSGGADSMYLLCRLLEGAEERGYTVCAAHYNHRLRETAGRDESFVRDWCAGHGVPLTVGSGNVAEYAAASGLGIEEAARELRYAFLEETAAARGCALIATGHHAGDNAETVLMNLIRGCGLRGLSGIPERRGNLIRPMLRVERREIDAWLAARGIPHVEDETNADPAYTRNRLRSQLIPLLEELNPRAMEHITAAAVRAGEDDRALTRQAEQLLEQCADTGEGPSIPVDVLLEAPRPVALRALARLAGEADSGHLNTLLALCGAGKPSASLSLPGGRIARRVYGSLLFSEGEAPPLPCVPLREGRQQWGDWHIACTPAVCPAKAYLSPEEFYLKTGPYLIRPRREGDGLQLGPRPYQTIKKLMIDSKLPRHLRHRVPVLEGEGGAAAAGGFGPHRDALALPDTACLHIIIRKGE